MEITGDGRYAETPSIILKVDLNLICPSKIYPCAITYFFPPFNLTIKRGKN